MASGCGMLTCPSCGYEFPRESAVVGWIGKLVRRKPRATADGV
jgi:hypothetical protein